ncbi:beta-N-acetylhexosaminidase [Nannocystis radixulma]|uniref:Beta-N-acetylhexosaminidase n=1 Tax=Nannocystis radixulma TaxID=2995305 RepID=A0ABT5BN74_9BACT|nr:beta-N-acetylhexosaminidase [Nannocystis radixulma]MDC0675624.1 beta-N-acetylhexosaminidase [Nannocystis radixulma]
MATWWQPGQLFFVGFEGTTLPLDLARLLGQGRIGGVILFARNIEGPAQLRGLVRALHEAAPPDVPLLVAIDQEGGRVQRLKAPWTLWPPMRALGRRDEPATTAAVAEALARELSDLGIGLDFAPSVDVDTNPANPVIGDRSFAAEPQRVARHATAFIAAMQAAGVAACAKHFPGHGDTRSDSHFELPRLSHDLDRLREVELVPFAAAARAGVASIMSAHVLFEALDRKRPATLSPPVMQLLRGELEYDGVVFTDDLEMKAVADHFTPEQRVRGSLEAGLDALLVCSKADLRDECLRVLERLPDALVEAPLRRVVALKQQYAPRHRDRVLGPRTPKQPPGLVADLFAAPEALRTPEPEQVGPPYPEHEELARRIKEER